MDTPERTIISWLTLGHHNVWLTLGVDITLVFDMIDEIYPGLSVGLSAAPFLLVLGKVIY